MNSYLSVNGLKIYNFKAKDSEINAAQLCSRGIGSKDFSAGNIKKIGLYGYVCGFQSTMIVH